MVAQKTFEKFHPKSYISNSFWPIRVVLDRCVTASDHPVLDKDFHVLYDFSILEPQFSKDACRRHERKTNLPKEMAKLYQSSLIVHPLSKALLERKWRYFGIYAYNGLFAAYICFVILLTFVVVTAVKRHLTPQLIRKSYERVKLYSYNASQTAGFQQLLQQADDMAESHPLLSGYIGCMFAILVLMVILLIKEAVKIHSMGYRYFMDMTNYLEVLMCGCCITYIVAFLYELFTEVPVSLTWQMGSITIFLAWFNLLRYCQPYGTVGIYAVMFFSVLKTLLKVSIFFFLLLAAFTVTFYELLPTFMFPDDPSYYTVMDPPNAKDMLTAHFNLPTSALRVGAMTLGDMDTIANFINPLVYGRMPFPTMTFILLVIFFLMMPILLNNLLIGLAVGDIKATMENAVEVCLQTQIEMYYFLEAFIPARFHGGLRGKLQYFHYYPNRPLSVVDKLTWLLSGGGENLMVNERALRERREHDQDDAKMQEEIIRLRQKVLELETRSQKQVAAPTSVPKKRQQDGAHNGRVNMVDSSPKERAQIVQV